MEDIFNICPCEFINGGPASYFATEYIPRKWKATIDPVKVRFASLSGMSSAQSKGKAVLVTCVVRSTAVIPEGGEAIHGVQVLEILGPPFLTHQPIV